MRSTSSRCTSSSVRPRERAAAHVGGDLVDGAAPRPCSAAISAASLTMRIGPVTSRRADERGRAAARAGGRARSGPTCGRRSRPRVAPPDEPRRRARSGRRSRPTGRSRTASGCGDDARRLEAGHDELGVAVAREHEHREPLERHRLVAGEVREVGADRQQQHVDAELRHPGPGPRHPLAVHQAGRRAGHQRVRIQNEPPWRSTPARAGSSHSGARIAASSASVLTKWFGSSTERRSPPASRYAASRYCSE